MLKHLNLRHVGPAPEIDLELAARLNVLTGDNGLGKTFALDVIWWALTRTWVDLPAWVSPEESRTPHIRFQHNGRGPQAGKTSDSSYHFQDQTWSPPRPKPPRRGVVVYARADGGFSVWDEMRNVESRGAKLSASPQAYHFTRGEAWDGLHDAGRVLCNGLIRDWVSWQQGGLPAFSALQVALEGLSPSHAERIEPGPPMRVRLDDARDIPSLEMPYGTVPLIHAAAGLKRCATLAYLLVWAWLEHRTTARLSKRKPADEVVLLIDELESHLHPQWQRAILPALLGVVTKLTGLDQGAIQIVAATHSPLILASLETLFDQELDRVVLFDLCDQGAKVTDVPWAKQGDVVGWLTSEVFGLQQARSREAEQAIEAAEAWMRRDHEELPPDLASQEAIHRELLRVLPGHDPFWPRWIVDREETEA